MERVYFYYEGALINTITTKMDLRRIVQIKVAPDVVTLVGIDGFSAVPLDTVEEALKLLSTKLPKGICVCNGCG